MKDNVKGTLKIFGLVLSIAFSFLVAALPFKMILRMVQIPYLLAALLTFIELIFPVSSIVFWVWGFVCAVQGTQDAWAIIFYVCTAILFIPYFITEVGKFFSK